MSKRQVKRTEKIVKILELYFKYLKKNTNICQKKLILEENEIQLIIDILTAYYYLIHFWYVGQTGILGKWIV